MTGDNTSVMRERSGQRRTERSRPCRSTPIGNVGAYADHSMFALKFAPVEATEVAFAHIPHVRFEGRGVYTNKMPACMMRGVGNSQLNLVLGRLVDGIGGSTRHRPA